MTLYSDGDKSNYPTLLPTKIEYCSYNETEWQNQSMILASINKTSVDYVSVWDTCLITITFCEDKINKIINNIQNNLNVKHIIYSNYTTSVINTICEKLIENKIGFYTIIGDIGFDEWKVLQDQFND